MRASLIISMLAAMMMLASPVLAAPPEAAHAIAAKQPYGSTTLRKFGFKVYDAELWTDAPKWAMTKTYALSLTYGINVKAADLVSRSLDEMQRIEPLGEGERERYAKVLAGVLPDVAKGDRITALYRPGRGLWLYHNGALKGRIADKSLAMHFMGIWLSPKTSEPAMRAALVRAPAAHKGHIRLE